MAKDDSTLADKEAILASLNIKAMTFDSTVFSNGEDIDNQSVSLKDSHIQGRTCHWVLL